MDADVDGWGRLLANGTETEGPRPRWRRQRTEHRRSRRRRRRRRSRSYRPIQQPESTITLKNTAPPLALGWMRALPWLPLASLPPHPSLVWCRPAWPSCHPFASQPRHLISPPSPSSFPPSDLFIQPVSIVPPHHPLPPIRSSSFSLLPPSSPSSASSRGGGCCMLHQRSIYPPN